MTNTLKHYGVLGMHWGRRKGSSNRLRGASSDYKRVSKIRKKQLHQMSNDEIKILAKRIELEKQYKDLNPGQLAKGQKKVDSVLSGLGKLSTGVATVTTLVVAGKKLYDLVKKLKVAS